MINQFFQWLSQGAEAFMALFQAGADQFSAMVLDIVPLLIALLVVMNTIIILVGQEKIEKFATKCSSNVLLRYMILPIVCTFTITNPMTLSFGRFLPEVYKPSYYAATSFTCHTMNGLFPHVNPGELFVFLGIASGIEALGYSSVDLAVRYFLVGVITNFIRGWVTDYTTKYVAKQQGVELDNKVKIAI